MITYYGEEIKIGDWIVWTPRKTCLDYGQVVGFTPKGYLKVRRYSILQNMFLDQFFKLSNKDDVTPPHIVKTKAVVRAKLTCITDDKDSLREEFEEWFEQFKKSNP